MGKYDWAQQESAGPWPDGWYAATILPQYEAGANKTIFKTEDVLSQAGDSRNIRLCFGVVRTNSEGFVTTETRNINYTLNYLPDDLGEERLAEVKAYKEEQGKVQVRNWSNKGMQRAFLTYSRLHELERVNGSELVPNGSGFDVSGLIGKNADVRIYTDERTEGKKFNAIGNLEPAGTKVK